jgi:CheY-like chemotaxis protein
MTSTPPTILIADDDPEDLELMEMAFAVVDPSAVLIKRNTGREALNYLVGQEDDRLPCLIILDFNMPELKGSELLSIISKEKRYEDIPKLVLSTSNAPIHVHECMASGATEYFVKPASLTEINRLAKKMLGFCKDYKGK